MDFGTSSHGTRRDPRRRRHQQARRRLLVLVAVVVIVVAVIAALALSRHKSDGPTQSGATAAATPKPTPPPKIWVATPAEPVRVWVGGDSMGGELGWGLGPMLDKAKVFKPILYYKESSGIARWDYFDWGRKLDSVLATAKPAAVAIMMGTNDTQSISDNGHWIAYGTSAWKAKYEKRVGRMMQAMLDGGARRIYWVGMPVMKQSWRNPRMKVINGIIQDQAALHPGAQYIDVWPLFTTPSGAYDSQWRGPDGVHFTVAGQDRLAKAVYTVIKKQWAPYGLPSATPSAGVSGAASPSP
jgi:uncharacterized protein